MSNGIKCGACKGRHETTAQVRLCYARKNGQATTTATEELPTVEDWAALKQQAAQREQEQERRAYENKMEAERILNGPLFPVKAAVSEDDEEEAAARILDGMTGRPGRDLASPKQVEYVMDLLNQHDWPDMLSEENVRNMERRQVSRLIDSIKATPRRTESVVPDVPAGRYAVYLPVHVPERNADGSIVNADISTGHMENELVFVEVQRYEDDHPRWAGRTFVKQLIGAPGDWRRERRSSMWEARVLTRILADPEAASIRYGKESRECGVCHSPLSTKASRKRGIGPKCAAKTGWGA